MQPGYTSSVRGPFSKQKERIQRLKKQDILNIIVGVN